MELLIGLIMLLIATVMMVAIGDRIGLPWPILLTLLAGVGMFVPGLPNGFTIHTELMLPIFIPPLLWALARRTSWGQIRVQWRSILLLSVALVLVTALAVGTAAYILVPALSLAGAIVIGAAVSPPDPVAVDAIAEPAGVPRRLTNTLQSEGLFNDAASILVFHVGLAVLLEEQTVVWWEVIVKFLYSAGLAVGLGWLIGFASAKFANWMNSSVARNALTWVIPFGTFIVAEHYGASGVIAIVIAAIEFNSRIDVGAEDRLSGTAFWEVVEMLFTGVAFGLIGVMTRDAIVEVGADLWEAVWLGVLLSLVAIAVRGVWFYGMYVFNRHLGAKTGAPLRLQEVLLLTWAGMRGLVTLALVLSIPMTSNFALNHEVAVVALVVLFVTMVLPGLTLPALMRTLSLDADPDAFGDISREVLVKRARAAAYDAMLSYADELGDEKLVALKARFDESAHLEEPDWDRMDPDARWRKVQKARALMNDAHLAALRAAQVELLQARNEKNVDPAILDEVLGNIDRQILGVKARKAEH